MDAKKIKNRVPVYFDGKLVNNLHYDPVRSIKYRVTLEFKLNKFLEEKALLQDKIMRIDSQIMSLIEERHKIIQFDSWMHHYSETVLISKMDLYDETARMYYGFMDYYESIGIPKCSKQYQVAKCKYRTAIVNLESIIDKINWIDSKFYRKEF